MRYALFVLVLLFSLMPASAQAAFDLPQIVPAVCSCDSVAYEGALTTNDNTVPSAPAYGCILQTIQNIIRVAIALGFVMATLALMYAGFVWMTSGGSAERRTKGKNMLLNVFVGLAVMLTAWLVVDFIMKSIYRDDAGFGPWKNILAGTGESGDYCLRPAPPSGLASGTTTLQTVTLGVTGGVGVSSPIQGTPGCPTCVRLEGFACTNNCTIDPAVRDRLVVLVRSFTGDWVVTEAYPPSTRHTNECHNNGTCIDAAFRGSTTYTAANITAFSQAASRAGLRAIFETIDCRLRDTARQAGVTAYCRSDNGYSHITGNHFSVYSH